MLKEILLSLFILSFLIQLYFYLRFFLPFSKFRVERSNKSSLSVSIIIASKNELKNLKSYLPLILNQEYETFEVIVVDDHSSDHTLEYLESINSNKLKVYSSIKSGKKAAIQFGIKNSKHKYLVFIDADCKPASEYWLSEITSCFNDKSQIVLGYGRFFKEEGFLNRLIRFEGLLSAVQYFSFALVDKPYMGVGRNLAYTKAIYEKSESFHKHSKLRSGDDDLIINEMANSTNTAISISPRSHTITKGKGTWFAYINQRRRQLQAGVHYKFDDRIRLMIFGLSNILLYIFFIGLMFFGEDQFFYSLLFVSKLIVQIIIFRKIMTNLGDRDLVGWIPILEFVYLIQISMVGVSTWIWKVNRWK